MKKTMPDLCRISVAEYKRCAKLPVCLVADNIRAAHNIGAILRTADAFRLAHVYMCGITPFPPNADIHKTALGAEESVDWSYCEDTVALISRLKDEGWCICSLEQAFGSIPLHDFQPDKGMKIAVVAGNEVEGVQEEVIALSDVILEIPQEGTKHSLNVSVSAALAMYTLYLKEFKEFKEI